jgi:hypothetical protein
VVLESRCPLAHGTGEKRPVTITVPSVEEVPNCPPSNRPVPRRSISPVVRFIVPLRVNGRVELPKMRRLFTRASVICTSILPVVELNVPEPPESMVIVDLFDPTRVTESFTKGGKSVI